MKPILKLTLAGLALLAIAAAGNQYFETLPGLVIRHPVTGVVTAHINGTNGTVTAAAFVGDGSGLTGVGGGVTITFTNGAYAVKTTDRFVVNDGGTNTLPSASSFGKNNSVTIKSYTTNGCTVWIQNATDTIDFSITNESLAFPISHNYMSDGTNNWMRW